MAKDQKSSELQSHFIQERIKMVEKHFTDICHQVGVYANRLAHLRDSGDDLSKIVMDYALKENLNQSVKTALKQFSTTLSALEDYREALILRLEAKVIQGPFSSYGKICKAAKVDLKHSSTVRSREMTKKQQLEKCQGRKPNWQQIAEKDYQAAVTESRESTKMLENRIEAFEEQKLHDIRGSFLEFITVEMLFHARALELYTEAYQAIAEINVDNDMEVFRNCLRTPSAQSRLDMVRVAMGPSSSTDSSVPPVISPLKQSHSLGSKVVHGYNNQEELLVPALSVPYRKLFSAPNLRSQHTDTTLTDDQEDLSESDSKESTRCPAHE